MSDEREAERREILADLLIAWDAYIEQLADPTLIASARQRAGIGVGLALAISRVTERATGEPRVEVYDRMREIAMASIDCALGLTEKGN